MDDAEFDRKAQVAKEESYAPKKKLPRFERLTGGGAGAICSLSLLAQKKDGDTMATAVEIGSKGEHLVAAWLNGRGYMTNVDTKAPGSTDIEANGPASILVQVKTAVLPNTPVSLSSDELRNIKSRATNTKREAWEARVQVDEKLNQVGEIQWKKLS